MNLIKNIIIIGLVVAVIALASHKPESEHFVRVCRIYHNNGRIETLNMSGTYYGSYSNPSSPITMVECKEF